MEIGFKSLGGPVLDSGPHVTVTFFDHNFDAPESLPFVELVIDGGDDNFAAARFITADEIRRLRNVLTNAERRMK